MFKIRRKVEIHIHPNSRGKPCVSVSGKDPSKTAFAYIKTVKILGLLAGKKTNEKEEKKGATNNG